MRDGVVLVISDHGYGDNPGQAPIQRGTNEWIQPSHWHTLDGVIAAAGGPVRPGEEISGATLLDVTPTILALLGIPVGEDMPGRPLTEVLDEPFLAEHPVTSVPTHEDGTRGDSVAIESAYDEEVLRRLRTLGYIE